MNANSKHTPGPWKAHVHINTGTIWVTDSKNREVVPWQAFDDQRVKIETHAANAHLIAAAPKLLCTLEVLTEAFETFPTTCADDEQAKFRTKTLDLLKATIAEAKGGSL